VPLAVILQNQAPADRVRRDLADVTGDLGQAQHDGTCPAPMPGQDIPGPLLCACSHDERDQNSLLADAFLEALEICGWVAVD